MTASGVVRVVDTKGTVVMEQAVDAKDILEMCQAKTHLFKTGLNLL
jgi:isocitrate dehydrogenase